VKVLGKKGKERQIKRILVDEMEWIAEHCDLLTLVALHEEFGFGADRLRKLFAKICVLHNEFKEKYIAEDDTQLTDGRCDTYAMKVYLKRIGFDYDAECEKILKGGEINAK
jgi:hypothetical protein